MKKLSKLKFQELSEVMPVLNEQELQHYVGGCGCNNQGSTYFQSLYNGDGNQGSSVYNSPYSFGSSSSGSTTQSDSVRVGIHYDGIHKFLSFTWKNDSIVTYGLYPSWHDSSEGHPENRPLIGVDTIVLGGNNTYFNISRQAAIEADSTFRNTNEFYNLWKNNCQHWANKQEDNLRP